MNSTECSSRYALSNSSNARLTTPRTPMGFHGWPSFTGRSLAATSPYSETAEMTTTTLAVPNWRAASSTASSEAIAEAAVRSAGSPGGSTARW